MWLVATIGLPFITVVTMGFAGTGVAATLGTLPLCQGSSDEDDCRQCLHFFYWLTLVFHFCYLHARPLKIRASVWSGESYEDRLAVSRRMFEISMVQ